MGINSFSMHGTAGEIRCAWYKAAALSRWELVMRENGATCHAALGETSYWLESDGPFDLVLDVGEHKWRWRNVQFHREHEKHVTLALEGKAEVI